MKRIVLIVIRLLWKVPYYLFALKKYKNIEKYSEEERYAFVRKFLRDITKAARVNVICTGVENLPEESGYLMTANHQGLYDPVIIGLTHPRPCTAVVKQELLKTPVVSQVCQIVQAQAMDRSNLRASMKVIRQVTKELKANRNYLIFPEGTRSKKGNQMGEFKAGTFKSAVDANKPIIPVACIDCYKVFDSNSTKKVTAQVHYLKPIYPEEYTELTTVELSKLVQSRIQDKMDEILKA